MYTGLYGLVVMEENELGGTKDDARGMIRTNDGDTTPSEVKAAAFDARMALIDAGVDLDDIPQDAESIVEMADDRGIDY